MSNNHPKSLFDQVRTIKGRALTSDDVATLNAAPLSDRAALFAAIRLIKGLGLTQGEVNAINAILAPRVTETSFWDIALAGLPNVPVPPPAPGGRSQAFYEGLIVAVTGRTITDASRAVAKAMVDHAARYGQDASHARLAEFIAQIANETGGFTTFEENLRYSARRLTQVWPGRFPTLAAAAPYAWDPTDPDREDIALANKTYGGRMGNERNGTNDNDGWNYRGRGALQLTGYDQYKRYGEATGLPLVEQPELAADPYDSVIIALEFFKQGNVNRYIDAGNFKAARGITNAGNPNFANPVGLDEVRRLRTRALNWLERAA